MYAPKRFIRAGCRMAGCKGKYYFFHCSNPIPLRRQYRARNSHAVYQQFGRGLDGNQVKLLDGMENTYLVVGVEGFCQVLSAVALQHVNHRNSSCHCQSKIRMSTPTMALESWGCAKRGQASHRDLKYGSISKGGQEGAEEA